MMNRHWVFPTLLFVVSGCATAPGSGSLSEAPRTAETWAAGEDDLTPPVVPVQPQTVSLTPEMFEDASIQAPTEISTVVQNAPATPSPSYTITTLTDPAIVRAAPQPVRILPQAAIPHSVPSLGVPPQSAAPKAMAFLDKLEQSGSAPDGGYGYVLIDAQDGTVLSERNADTPMAPASIAKMLAAIAILEAKGPGGSFRTALHADGPISGGVLQGDLHLIGSGDPSLNRSDLSGLARRLASAGVRSVSGSFYYHGDALPEVSMIDAGQPKGAVYNPGLSGLNLDHNERRGSSPVSDPALYTAQAMHRAAQVAGVTLPTPKRGSGGVRGSEIAAHDSAPVSTILTEMFDISRNMTAEALGAAAAVELSRKPSSLRDAAQINAEWAQSQIGTIGGSEWSGFDFANNSGLSTRSRATPRQMAALVRYGFQRHGDTFKKIYEQQSSGQGFSIRAKIGTMSFVRGLGGIMTVGNREMVFAIMANNASRSGGAKVWMGKARRLEQALMSDWLQNNWPATQTAGLQ